MNGMRKEEKKKKKKRGRSSFYNVHTNSKKKVVAKHTGNRNTLRDERVKGHPKTTPRSEKEQQTRYPGEPNAEGWLLVRTVRTGYRLVSHSQNRRIGDRRPTASSQQQYCTYEYLRGGQKSSPTTWERDREQWTLEGEGHHITSTKLIILRTTTDCSINLCSQLHYYSSSTGSCRSFSFEMLQMRVLEKGCGGRVSDSTRPDVSVSNPSL